MEEWGNFYLTIGASSATLLGLMFIAVTFGSRLVTPETDELARSIFSPIFFHFAQSFVVACAALMPGTGIKPLGISLVGTAAVRLGLIPRLIGQMKLAEDTESDIQRSDWILSVMIPSVLYGAMIISGFCLFTGADWALTAIGILVASMLVLGAYTAWDMVIWMATKVTDEA